MKTCIACKLHGTKDFRGLNQVSLLCLGLLELLIDSLEAPVISVASGTMEIMPIGGKESEGGRRRSHKKVLYHIET